MTGEMEESKFFRFCRMQNLRIALGKNQIPEGAEEIIPIFNKFYHGQNRGTLQDEMGHREPRKMNKTKLRSDKSLIEFVVDWSRNRRAHFQIRAPEVTTSIHEERFGQRFEAHVDGNNCVLFRENPDIRSTELVGTILMIFLHNREPHFVIQQYRNLTADNTVLDPFRRFPSAGYLVYADCEPEWRVVPFSSIISHFAKTRLPKAFNTSLGFDSLVFHVLPLPGY